MTSYTSAYVDANGIRQHYHRSTPANPRLTVVMLHGITDNGMCWVRVADDLRDRYDVIMVDARGHGLSDAPESGYTTADRAADVAGLIQALQLDRPVLFGHSMGADTASAAAALYPDLLRGVVLEDPPWFAAPAVPPTPEENKQRGIAWQAEIVERKAMSKEQLIDLARTNSPTWPEIELGPWAESKQQVSPKVVNAFSGAHPRRPWQEWAKDIRCPVLLVTADPALHAIVTPAIAEQALGYMKAGEVLNVPDAGHCIHREQFEPVMDGVKAFLKKLE